jgi:hypothetical protein
MEAALCSALRLAYFLLSKIGVLSVQRRLLELRSSSNSAHENQLDTRTRDHARFQNQSMEGKASQSLIPRSGRRTLKAPVLGKLGSENTSLVEKLDR